MQEATLPPQYLDRTELVSSSDHQPCQRNRMLTSSSLQSAMAKGVFMKRRGPGDSPSADREPALDIILRTAIEVAEGMACMHEHEILHC